MKDKHLNNHLLVLLPLLGLLLSCSEMKEDLPFGTSGQGGDSIALLTLDVSGPPATKTTGPDTGIDKLYVYIFRVTGDPTLNIMDTYGEFDSTGKSLSLSTSTGKKHIYLIANGDSGTDEVAKRVKKESDLLSQITKFEDNLPGSLLMTGSGQRDGNFEPVLVPGNGEANHITAELRRICAKVTVGEIVADFLSPAVRQSDLRVKRVFLMNVPKEVPLINGNHKDVLGHEGASPEGFVKSPDAPHYYYYTIPGNDGFFNWAPPYNYLSGQVEVSGEAKDLTYKEFGQEAYLYTSPGSGRDPLPLNTLAVKENFYSYPNCSANNKDFSRDETTRLVIETGLDLGDGEGEKTLYYSISIPYLQPNYVYNISRVILRHPGFEDPYNPEVFLSCQYSVSVSDWYNAQIYSSLNQTSTDDPSCFEF